MKNYFWPSSLRLQRVALFQSQQSPVLAGIIAVAVILPGCKSDQPTNEKPSPSILETFNSSVSDISKTIDSSTKETRESVQQLATEELEKLYKYEYKVVSLPASLSDQEMEAQLSELGRERWHCFHGETVNGSTRLICSRLPLSVLKFVPYIWKVF